MPVVWVLFIPRWREKHLETIVNGLRVNYITAGEGQPVLLLHGWGSSIVPYRQLIDLLLQLAQEACDEA